MTALPPHQPSLHPGCTPGHQGGLFFGRGALWQGRVDAQPSQELARPLTVPSVSRPQQSQPKSAGEKSQRSKKAKELKPKVKKLKYHQYIPPDQKQDKGAPPMDSSYAKILQQQQLFLQLQILSQQHQHYNYQTILPAPLKYGFVNWVYCGVYEQPLVSEGGAL